MATEGYRLRARRELKESGRSALSLTKAERNERDHPVPAWNKWLKAMPGACSVCDVKDEGRDWMSWTNVHGHLWIAHRECLRDPVSKMLRRS